MIHKLNYKGHGWILFGLYSLVFVEAFLIAYRWLLHFRILWFKPGGFMQKLLGEKLCPLLYKQSD